MKEKLFKIAFGISLLMNIYFIAVGFVPRRIKIGYKSFIVYRGTVIPYSYNIYMTEKHIKSNSLF